MRVSSVTSVCVTTIAAVLSGCTSSPQGAQTVPAGPAIARETGGAQFRDNSLRRLSVTYRLIHSFGRSGDGYYPQAALLYVNGSFYGTTGSGSGASGPGTVFKITSGKETVLHNFDSIDGANPTAKLININGTLYGATPNGGANGYGTVFSITRSGQLTTVYNFAGYPADGAGPVGELANVNGTLYGETFEGGTYDDGTVFSVTTTGRETVLHSFADGSDGCCPGVGGLININGMLYGTTTEGGGAGSCGNGCGTAFEATTSGRENVLHRFSGSPDDGAGPVGLTNVNGMIYGTTGGGGVNACQCGTVFSIDASGKEKVLHSFAGSPDGEFPESKLLNVSGTLFGTTILGGAYSKGSVFTITTSGQEAVLYSFKGLGAGHRDGKSPVGGLIDVKGTLFGTTVNGGAYTQCHRNSGGCGTVFSISP